MITFCIQNLNEIKNLCEQLDPKKYSKSLEILSGSSLGQHIRHIVELYQAIPKSEFSDNINYDQRGRNLEIETNPLVAALEIQHILEFLESITQDKPLTLVGDYGMDMDATIYIKSSLFRELAYNLDHAIHHQALIKIGLNQLDLASLISSNFGIAPSTIRFRNSQLSLQES